METEEDEEVAKVILSRLALAPDDSVAATLIATAASHPDPQIRRAAGWLVEELDEALLRRNMLTMLPDSDEETQAYILTKMGQRQLPDCGAVISSCAGAEHPARVRYAALEGLGFLREKAFLPAVVPGIQSADPMEAYVATLAAVQLIDRLDACPELIELLLSPGAEAVVLKQVVLQFMIDTVSWQFDDSKLFEVLANNLRAENDNIRYLSAILLGKCQGRTELVPDLRAAAFDDPSPEVRQAARASLDSVLAGDLSCFFASLQQGEIPLADLGHCIDLLAELQWNAFSARQALGVFADLGHLDDQPELLPKLEEIARAVYQAAPEASRDYFKKTAPGTRWRLALGRAWLQSLGEMTHAKDRADWNLLFAGDEAALVLEAARQAVEVRADWAVAFLLGRIGRQPDDPLNPRLRTAVKKLLGL